VVSGTRDDYTDHPTVAFLLVEVSDTTLASDRLRKGSLYARAGVLDYWILNLVDEQLEVYRDPRTDAAKPYGFGYASVTILKKGQTVTRWQTLAPPSRSPISCKQLGHRFEIFNLRNALPKFFFDSHDGGKHRARTAGTGAAQAHPQHALLDGEHLDADAVQGQGGSHFLRQDPRHARLQFLHHLLLVA
jgi:hypothetical protein